MSRYRSRRLRHGQPAFGGEGAGACRAGCVHRGDQRSRGEIAQAGRVVFPGSGRDAGLHARTGCARPASGAGRGGTDQAFSGICMGMQVLFEHSEEGDVAWSGRAARQGAALFRTRRCMMTQGQQTQSAAHGLERGASGGAASVVGWNRQGRALLFRAQLLRRGGQSPNWWRRLPIIPSPFACAVARDNIFAVQFHPEKSQAAGLKLLANFVTGIGNGQVCNPV